MTTTTDGRRRAEPVPPLSDEQRRLIEDHLDLVDHMAKRMATVSIPFDDRRQDGMIGLIDAARDYDPTRGATFATFATMKIRSAMIDAERAGAGALIRVPRLAWAKMTAKERRASQPHVRFRWRRSDTAGGADGPWGRDDDVIDPAAPIDDEPYDAEMIRLGLDRLGGKMAEAMRLHYWQGLSMREVGRRLGVSESRVSQMHSAAIERLREQTFARRAVAS